MGQWLGNSRIHRSFSERIAKQAVEPDSRARLEADANFPRYPYVHTNTKLSTGRVKGGRHSWRKQLSVSRHAGCRDFGQVTCPTFPPSKVTQSETGGLPECVSVSVCVSTRTGKEANTTDACGFPPGPQTLTSLSPKRKHKTKCLAQNKQAARAEGVLAMTARQRSHATYTHHL